MYYKVLFMKSEQEYIRDLTEIRSMMERSTKFLSLSGWSGILAGVYALAGAYIAYEFYYSSVAAVSYSETGEAAPAGDLTGLFLLALAVLVLAVGTAIFLSWRKAGRTGEKLWNSAARRLTFNMAIPLVTGGLFVLILFSKGILELIAPATLIFYGLALLNASKFTYEELRSLGITQVVLGLLASYFTGYGLLFWAIGFGLMHIIYGILMHLKYEK